MRGPASYEKRATESEARKLSSSQATVHRPSQCRAQRCSESIGSRSGKRQRRRKKTCGQDAGQCCQSQNAQRALPSLLSGYERCRQPKRAANHTGCKHGAAHSEAEHQRKRSHHSRNPMQSVVSSNQLAEIVDSTMDELTPAHSRKSPYRSGPSKSLPSKYAERSLFWHDTNFLRT